jgi:glycosyltransferase involved in cell wall biosynthesis
LKKLIRITTIPLSLDKLLGKQLTYMNQFYEVTAIAADETELKRVAEKYGVKHHHVEMTRTISPIKDGIAVWKLYRFLVNEKPEIVHSHTPKAGIVGMMAAYFAGVPNRFHTVAGLPLLEATGFKRVVLNWVEKLTYRFATKVYPNSFEMEKIIIKEEFCSAEKLHVIGNGSSNGIDVANFNRDEVSVSDRQILKKQLGIQENDFVFIFVGRLVKDKGINELITAFKNLNLSLRNSALKQPLKLLLVGPLEQELNPLLPETLATIQSHSQIITVGFQKDVRLYFSISDCLVFPSYREGFPNAVLQAGAMSLPSIVTNINGCNEIINEGENGLIIPVKNEKDLEVAMIKITENSEVYEKMKVQSRPKVVERYSQQNVWNDLLKEYREALSK